MEGAGVAVWLATLMALMFLLGWVCSEAYIRWMERRWRRKHGSFRA